MSVFAPDGTVLARWGGADRCAPHAICVDSLGHMYVGEVTYTFAARAGLVPPDCHTFQKFIRVGSAGRA